MQANIQDFMISKTRVKLFELFFVDPEEIHYVRDISRKTKQEINAVRRELNKMMEYGLLRSEERGNRLYYSLNKRYTFYDELQQMVAKTTGLGKKIRKMSRKLGRVDFVMFSGRFVKHQRPEPEEVEILVIGEIVLPELQALIKEEEKALGREINYAVFDLEEFEFRKTRRDPFTMDILMNSRVMIMGSNDEFSHREKPGLN